MMNKILFSELILHKIQVDLKLIHTKEEKLDSEDSSKNVASIKKTIQRDRKKILSSNR